MRLLRPRPRATSSERAEYAARQAELLDALMRRDAALPPGFDPVKADAAGRALRRKRASAVRHAWPSLTSALGRDFEPRIDAFLNAYPSSGSGLADGLAFVRWIADSVGEGEPQGQRQIDPALTGDVQVEIMLSRAATRRLFVGARLLADPRRLVVVLGLRRIGLRVLCLRLGRD